MKSVNVHKIIEREKNDRGLSMHFRLLFYIPLWIFWNNIKWKLIIGDVPNLIHVFWIWFHFVDRLLTSHLRPSISTTLPLVAFHGTTPIATLLNEAILLYPAVLSKLFSQHLIFMWNTHFSLKFMIGKDISKPPLFLNEII